MFEELFALYSAGKIRAPVSEVLPLSCFGEALRMVERREVIGKIALSPRDGS